MTKMASHVLLDGTKMSKMYYGLKPIRAFIKILICSWSSHLLLYWVVENVLFHFYWFFKILLNFSFLVSKIEFHFIEK